MQLYVSSFIGDWLKFRVPALLNHFSDLASLGPKVTIPDLVHSELGIAKELEILETIFNGDSEFYNYRVSKNTPDIEKVLSEQYN